MWKPTWTFCISCACLHPEVAQGYSFYQTGNLFVSDYQIRKSGDHTTGSYSKTGPNGIFLNSPGYQLPVLVETSRASGFYELEANGCVNAYFDFDRPIANIQLSGVVIGNTRLMKTVLLNYPDKAHPYGAKGCLSLKDRCARCGVLLFDHTKKSPFTMF